MAYAYNPSTLGGWRGWITWGQEFETAWPTWWNPISTNNTEISRVWWQVPIIPAIQESEAGELLEPVGWRLRWAEMAPLHSSLGNKSETPSQKKRKKKERKKHRVILHFQRQVAGLSMYGWIWVEILAWQTCSQSNSMTLFLAFTSKLN